MIELDILSKADKEADDASIAAAQQLVEKGEINPPQHCSACHR